MPELWCCPLCFGDGVIVIPGKPPHGYVRERRCWTCDGTGFVTQAEVNAYRAALGAAETSEEAANA